MFRSLAWTEALHLKARDKEGARYLFTLLKEGGVAGLLVGGYVHTSSMGISLVRVVLVLALALGR